MKNKKILVWGGILAFVLILVFWFMGIYNNAVAYEEEVDEAWGNVQNQYQRRFDLYRPLVEAINKATKQEKEVLIGVTENRALVKIAEDFSSAEQSFKNAKTPGQLDQSANKVIAAGTSLMGYQERYPELRSLATIENFQAQVEGTENRIQKARKAYNEKVKIFNTHIRKFPNSMLTGSFDKREAFQSDSGAEKAPEVNFD